MVLNKPFIAVERPRFGGLLKGACHRASSALSPPWCSYKSQVTEFSGLGAQTQ
jgi:hypothetical protein